MKNTLGAAIWATVIGLSALMGACGDDDGGSTGGDGGEAVGGEPGSSGGKAGSGSGGKAGSDSGGKAGSATGDAGASGMGQAGAKPSEGGAGIGGESSGGAPGAGGANEGGSAPEPMGGAAGATGEGGAPSTTLEYACTANSISHKICSAYAAAECPEEFDCATCVGDRNGERELFSDCATCAAEFDKFFQCGVDAFESGNLSAGVECVPDWGPDMTFDCYVQFDNAMNCNEWAATNSCPEMWPLD